MTTPTTIKTDPQESIHQYAQKLVSRFADRESLGETAQDLVLEIIGEGKGRKGKPTKRQLKLAARCLVTTLLHDPYYQRRATAIRMIEELLLLLPGVERAFIKALQDPSVRVRGYAARAIGKLKCTSAVQPLLDLLTGEESDKARIRATQTEERPWRYSPDEYNWLDYAFAIKALGILGDQRAVEPLLAYLRRLPPDIFDPEEFRRSLESPPSLSWEWEIPDQPVWHKHNIRARLIDALGKLRDPRATETLCEFLADSDGQISCAAACALKEIHDPRAIDPLINALIPSYVDLHKEIKEALLTFAGDELVEKLIAALPSDSETALRSGIIPLLGDLQATQTIELLLTRLSTEENLELRETLVRTLGKLGASQAKEPLYLLLQQFDGIPEEHEYHYQNGELNLYSALFFALAQLGDTRVLDILVQAALLEGSSIQSTAIDGLIALDPQRAGETLITLLRNWKPKGSNTSFDLTIIINALTELGDKRAGGPLIEVLATLDDRQKYRFDRYKIIKALGKLGDQSAVEPLMTVFQQGPVPEPPSPYIRDREDNFTEAEYSAETLGNLGDPRASKLLISYLKNRSQIRWDLASYVIKALGQLGDTAALPHIKWALHFAGNKILELPPKARSKYRIWKIKNNALIAISNITKTPLKEDLDPEYHSRFDMDDL